MRKLSLEETKKIQIEILNVFKKFCDDNMLRFWLDSGTLLGAVRFKGYIPWDDDIDTGMFRDDFEKMVHSFNSYSERYKCISVENDPKIPVSYAKICDTKTVLNEKGVESAVFIDVLPYDEIPDNSLKRAIMFSYRDVLYTFDILRKENTRPHGNALRRSLVYAGRAVAGLFPLGFFAGKIADNAVRCRNDGHDTVARMTYLSGIHCNKSVFETLDKAEFEGKMYPIPGGYDEVLTRLYGDYKTLPPEEKRVTHHEFEAYIIE